MPKSIERLVVAVTIHDADNRGQNFGQVREAFIRIEDLDRDVEIARFDLSEGLFGRNCHDIRGVIPPQ